MDIIYCCERAEECLAKAHDALSRDQRYAWHLLAAAWIDYAEEAHEREQGRAEGERRSH